jgi:hypothetical protein
MGKKKTVDLLSFADSEKRELMQEIRRQIRQKILEDRLARSLLSKKINYKTNYPKGITVEDSVRKTDVDDLIRKTEEAEAKRSQYLLIRHPL